MMLTVAVCAFLLVAGASAEKDALVEFQENVLKLQLAAQAIQHKNEGTRLSNLPGVGLSVVS